MRLLRLLLEGIGCVFNADATVVIGLWKMSDGEMRGVDARRRESAHESDGERRALGVPEARVMLLERDCSQILPGSG